MANTAPAAAQKVKKVAKPADHPKYNEMVKAAIADMKERGGSSRQKILKYIMSNYNVGEEKTVNTHVKKALCTGVKSGLLNQSKGTGASGSFRLSDAAKKAPAKPKNPVAKKPAAIQSADKKVTKAKKTKSPAKKATQVKKLKSPTAKQTVRKDVKKPVAEKSTPKKPVVKKPVKKVAKKPATK